MRVCGISREEGRLGGWSEDGRGEACLFLEGMVLWMGGGGEVMLATRDDGSAGWKSPAPGCPGTEGHHLTVTTK